MLNIMSITAAIMPQFIYSLIIFNDYISIVRLQPVVFVSCYAAVLLYFTHYAQYYMLMRKLAPHFAPSWHDYYIYHK